MSPSVHWRAPQAPPIKSRRSLWTPLVIAAGVLVIALLVFGCGRSSGDAEAFVVPKGASLSQVAKRLEAEGYIRSARAFLAWAKLHGGKAALRPGVYTLSKSEGTRSILEKFKKGPPLVRVTFPEGWSARQMAELLDAKGVTSGAAFLALANKEKREGFLFPDTYFFDQGLAPRTVIDRMVARFEQMAPTDLAQRAKALKLTQKQVVTLASLVEKEARVAEEQPLIAGVYLNRLRKGMRLEADPTVQYALGTWKDRLYYKDLEVKSPYNTYRHAGLPPGPICNPGASALRAAAHPAKTDYLFFVADPQTGRHRFTRTYQEHLNVQKAMRRR